MATAYGNSTTTTYGSQTSHVPMTFNRYEFGAAYFVKKKFTFGANYRDLTNEERAALQSNSSIYVDSVVNDTPAFRNDLLVGDIIAKLDGPGDLWAASCNRHVVPQTRSRGRANNSSQGTTHRKEDEVSQLADLASIQISSISCSWWRKPNMEP